MMTREEVLTEMQEGFDHMTPEVRETTILTKDGKNWTPNMIMEAIRNDTEDGQRFAREWSEDRDLQAKEEEDMKMLLDLLLGGAPPPPCDDPACTACHPTPELPPPSQQN
jgi:hypothetical protein